MKKLAAVLFALIVAPAFAQLPAGAEGTWIVTNAAGKTPPVGMAVAMIISRDGYQGATNGKVDERGTLKVDASAKPMTFDLAITEGSSAGKTQLGLAELSGDTMRVALAEPGVPTRPTAFGSEQTLTLTKIKPLAPALAGRWEADIAIGSVTQRVAVTLANGPDGLATGTIGPANQSETVPITAVVQMGTTVRLIIAQARATFEGTLEGGELRGTWSQGPQSVPAVFKKR